jgi:hypothetical protein
LKTLFALLMFVGVWAVVVKAVLHFFDAKLEWPDVMIAVVPSALLRVFVPSIGGYVAYLALLGLLYWRVGEKQHAVVVAVGAAYVASLPVAIWGLQRAG